MCVDENIPVIPIPGPCAVVAALSASGLDTDEFTFGNFVLNLMLIYVSDVLLVALGLSKINDIKYFFSWISFQAWSFQERKADSFCK